MRKTKNIEVAEVLESDGKFTLRLLSPVTLQNAPFYDRFLGKISFSEGTNEFNADFSQIADYDTYLVLLVKSLQELASDHNISLKLSGLSDQSDNFIGRFSFSDVSELKKAKQSFLHKYFSYIGSEAINFFSDVKNFIEFFGELFLSLLKLFINPGKMRWKDFPFHFMRSGVNAIFISLLILTLLGLITGYQAAIQMKQFGADIYVANLIGISITRELSPLMIAILVAGRSGSAFAAEIGTMKVSEEIDALKSMGFDYIQFLVLPRVLSVAIAIPILTILADAAGISGGIIASLATLNITLTGFLGQLQKALTFSDVFSGLGKSVVFGFLIAAVGCFRGMQVRGGAESVGKYTTVSVVTGILMIILADAVFTFLFDALGI